MNKKIWAIAIVLLAVVAGVSFAQSGDNLLKKYEEVAKAFEDLAMESDTFVAQKNRSPIVATRLENRRQMLLTRRNTSENHLGSFFSTSRITPTQNARMGKIADRILRADERIDANIRTINSKR